ncbi:MAG: glycosyltransferase, partial [Omnitrophica bacterium]|nr:glycosyltransferase [Candidatus Omnitrophota bacterium]
MNYPFISIIMPCGDEVNFIRKSLGSLLKTEYPKENLEIIIVVDEQSDDGTKKILQEMASKNSMVKILNNPHRTVPFAMNKGIKASTGKIVIRVDAHTEYPSDYIPKCVEYLNKTDAW